MALLGPFNSAVINPAILPLANYFHISKVEGSWQTTTCILAAGIAPLFWTPLANIYGRRPIYLMSTLIGIGATVGTGLSPTWPGMIVARVFSGAATSAPMALGAAVVSDLFFLHEVSSRLNGVVLAYGEIERYENGCLDRLLDK
jgi:MFS family permease